MGGTRTVTHLSPLDVWFWDVEGRANHQHIGSIAVFEGPEPDVLELRAALGAVLPNVPRYRQQCVPVPLGLGRPVWVDCEPDLTYHVRRTAVPAPGGDEELTTLMGRVMSQPLDRTRPLWEAWMVSGLAGRRWAMINKVHHCLVDGVAGNDVMAALFDTTPEPGEPPVDDRVLSEPPSQLDLLRDAVHHILTDPLEGARRATRALRDPRRAFRSSKRFVHGMSDLLTAAVPTDASGLNGRIGTHRVYALARTTVDDVRTVRAATGATFNDVALTAVAAGFRELLLARDVELPGGATVRTMVPVSVRTEAERGQFDNRVSTMFVELPVGLSDPVQQLLHVQLDTRRHKESGEAQAGALLISALGYLPPPVVETATRVVAKTVNRVVQHSFATVATNVPGPPVPLYVLGRRLVELFPYVLVGEGLTIGVAMFSYDGALTFGVTGDVDASPDVAILATGIEDGLAALVAAHR